MACENLPSVIPQWSNWIVFGHEEYPDWRMELSLPTLVGGDKQIGVFILVGSYVAEAQMGYDSRIMSYETKPTQLNLIYDCAMEVNNIDTFSPHIYFKLLARQRVIFVYIQASILIITPHFA
jgi:hypothetical protein